MASYDHWTFDPEDLDDLLKAVDAPKEQQYLSREIEIPAELHPHSGISATEAEAAPAPPPPLEGQTPANLPTSLSVLQLQDQNQDPVDPPPGMENVDPAPTPIPAIQSQLQSQGGPAQNPSLFRHLAPVTQRSQAACSSADLNINGVNNNVTAASPEVSPPASSSTSVQNGTCIGAGNANVYRRMWNQLPAQAKAHAYRLWRAGARGVLHFAPRPVGPPPLSNQQQPRPQQLIIVNRQPPPSGIGFTVTQNGAGPGTAGASASTSAATPPTQLTLVAMARGQGQAQAQARPGPASGISMRGWASPPPWMMQRIRLVRMPGPRAQQFQQAWGGYHPHFAPPQTATAAASRTPTVIAHAPAAALKRGRTRKQKLPLPDVAVTVVAFTSGALQLPTPSAPVPVFYMNKADSDDDKNKNGDGGKKPRPAPAAPEYLSALQTKTDLKVELEEVSIKQEPADDDDPMQGGMIAIKNDVDIKPECRSCEQINIKQEPKDGDGGAGGAARKRNRNIVLKERCPECGHQPVNLRSQKSFNGIFVRYKACKGKGVRNVGIAYAKDGKLVLPCPFSSQF